MSKKSRLLTLEQFIVDRQHESPSATGTFSRLLRDLSIAAKIVQRDVRRAGLVDIFGESGEINIQGEVQQKLDKLAHEEFVKALRRGGTCCLIGSEEHAEAIPIRNDNPDDSGEYIVLLDPLDGSSNIDVNVSIGTIFSVYRLPDGVVEPALEHALQAGVHQIAAGYVLYGSSVMLVYTTGHGVNGFTLDPSIGEFILSHPDIRAPKTGKIYSINEGNYEAWPLGLKKYLKYCQEEVPDKSRPYTSRYIGSFVSDFHRNLLKGGIYIYPTDTRSPRGKLRLMYEANPMAFLIEQAGGIATDGHGNRILDIQPQALHERTPVYIGSANMVEKAEEFLRVWGM